MKPRRTAGTSATDAAASLAEERAGFATLGDLLEEMDWLHHRKSVLSALLDHLYDNFVGIEQEAPRARIARTDGSKVPPREDVVTAITAEISRAAAATRDRLGVILATRVQGLPAGNVPCVSPDGPEERRHMPEPADPGSDAARGADVEPTPAQEATSRRRRSSTKRGTSRKRSATKGPPA